MSDNTTPKEGVVKCRYRYCEKCYRPIFDGREHICTPPVLFDCNYSEIRNEIEALENQANPDSKYRDAIRWMLAKLDEKHGRKGA